jgi:uncharacterized protein (DUF2249 family)
MEKLGTPIPITPETKVGALLKNFPQLEETLLKLSPEFKKLRNPILRKTIARVATLRQVAAVGKISLAEMINRLREAAGVEGRMGADDAEVPASKGKPSWFAVAKIVKSLDARPLLERGEQPMNRVFLDCKKLHSGEIYELIAPFLPSPLIAEAEKQGYSVWTREEKGRVLTYFTPKS